MSTKGGIYSDQRCPVCQGNFRDFGAVPRKTNVIEFKKVKENE